MVQGLRVRISRLSRTRLGISSREQRSPFVERLEAVIRVRETENREFSFSRFDHRRFWLRNRSKLFRINVYASQTNSPFPRFIYPFPIEKLLETRVSWYGETMGAKTGRPSGGLRACVYTR